MQKHPQQWEALAAGAAAIFSHPASVGLGAECQGQDGILGTRKAVWQGLRECVRKSF